MQVNFTGIIVAIATFLIIGLFHPIVIKSEYYWGVKCWWVFALLGAVTLLLSILTSNFIVSMLLGVLAVTFFWSILEIFEQRERVRKGWFPKNPKRRG